VRDDANGQATCGGKDRTGSAWGSPGKPSNDKLILSVRADARQQVFDDCLEDEWKNRDRNTESRLHDCQDYDDDVNSRCRKNAGLSDGNDRAHAATRTVRFCGAVAARPVLFIDVPSLVVQVNSWAVSLRVLPVAILLNISKPSCSPCREGSVGIAKAAWIGIAIVALLVTLYGFDGKTNSEIWIVLTWSMLVLSFLRV